MIYRSLLDPIPLLITFVLEGGNEERLQFVTNQLEIFVDSLGNLVQDGDAATVTGVERFGGQIYIILYISL